MASTATSLFRTAARRTLVNASRMNAKYSVGAVRFNTTTYYANSHEWLKVDNDGTATMGISDHAQTLLGDVVFVDIPDTDEEVVAGESFMLVESVKAASDIYAPIDGTIIAVNESLEDSPEIVNESPEDEAWMVKIKIDDRSQLDNLMSLEEYLATIESE